MRCLARVAFPSALQNAAETKVARHSPDGAALAVTLPPLPPGRVRSQTGLWPSLGVGGAVTILPYLLRLGRAPRFNLPL